MDIFSKLIQCKRQSGQSIGLKDVFVNFKEKKRYLKPLSTNKQTQNKAGSEKGFLL